MPTRQVGFFAFIGWGVEDTFEGLSGINWKKFGTISSTNTILEEPSMKKFISSILILILVFGLARIVFGAKKLEDDYFDLTILHINDVHGAVEKYPLLKSAVTKVRKSSPNVIFLLAGDVFAGSPYFTHYEGMADLYFLNQLDIDAFTFGNHEFDRGPETLRKFINEARFPFVSSNVRFPGAFKEIRKDEVPLKIERGTIYPAIIKEIGGEKIGIFGLTTESTKLRGKAWEDAAILNAFESAKTIVKRFQKMGINKIVALSHLGYEVDKKLAEGVDGIDVIVGGHSHTKLLKPQLVQKKEPVLIVQAYERLKHLGVLNVRFDGEGKIILYDGTLQKLVDGIFPRDKKFQKKVEKFRSSLDPSLFETIAKSEVFLDGERPHIWKGETNLGNLIADGLRWYAQKQDQEITIGMISAGNIRSSIEKGNITRMDLMVTLPFNTSLAMAKLSGKEIVKVLEESLAKYPEGNPKFLHVSGLKVKFNPMLLPGDRIVFVEVLHPDGHFLPIAPKRIYKVCVNSTIAFGDYYQVFKQAKKDGRIKKIDATDFEVISSYLMEMAVLTSIDEGRIIPLDEESFSTSYDNLSIY